MPIKTKANGVIKEVSNCKVKVNGVWKQVTGAFVKVNGAWKQAWSSNVIVSDFSLTNTKSFEIYERKYDKVTDLIKVKNLVIKCYNHDGDIIYTYTEKEDTISSISINLDGNGDLGITTSKSENKITFSFNMDVSELAKAVLTIGSIELVE